MKENEKLMDEMSYDRYGSTDVNEILESKAYQSDFEELINCFEKEIKEKGRDFDDDFQM